MNKLLLLVFFIGSHSVWSQNQTVLERTSTNDHEHYGWNTVINDDWVVVGSPHSSVENTLKAGKVDVFSKNESGTWELFQVLTDSAVSAYVNFGYAVAIFDDYLAVGAIGSAIQGPNSGKVILYKFENNTWEKVDQFLSGTAKAVQWFGNALAMNADYLAVGAFKGDGVNEGSGEVYVIENYASSSPNMKRLTTSKQKKGDSFGYAIAMSEGGEIIVGAPDTEGDYASAGAAYVFKKEGAVWTESDFLVLDDQGISDQFGFSVDITNSKIAVGSIMGDGVDKNTGVVVSYEKAEDKWTNSTTVQLGDGKLNDYFGNSVAISDSSLLVGAPRRNGSHKNAGSCYLYEWSQGNWQLAETIVEENINAHNFFGINVSMNDHQLVVSSQLNDSKEVDAGEVYVINQTTSSLGEPLQVSDNVDAFPIPAKDQIVIKYGLVSSSVVNLYILDSQGRKIKSLVSGVIQNGSQEVPWNLKTDAGSRVSPGTYFYTLEFGENTASGKVVVQ